MDKLDKLGSLFDKVYRNGHVFMGPEALGRHLRTVRGKRTLRDVGYEVGASVTSVHDAETGRASLGVIERIADKMGYDLVVMMVKR